MAEKFGTISNSSASSLADDVLGDAVDSLALEDVEVDLTLVLILGNFLKTNTKFNVICKVNAN